MATKPLIINAGRFEQLSDGEGLDVGGWTLPEAAGTETYVLIADAGGDAVWTTPSFGSDIPANSAQYEVYVGTGVGTADWTTDLVLTSLTVDNITINGAVISSDTGAISFSNENLTTTGTIIGKLISNTGVVYLEGSAYAYTGMLAYLGAETESGTCVIDLPSGFINRMQALRILGYNYSSNTGGAWSVIVGGYNYTATGTWLSHHASIQGNPPFTDIRLGWNGNTNKACIMLGTTSSSWSDPLLFLEAMIHRGVANYHTGWAVNFYTDESNFTGQSGYADPVTVEVYRDFISPNASDGVLVSTGVGTADWSIAGNNQVLTSDGSGEVAWTDKNFADGIPANSAINEIYVGTGAGTADWTTDIVLTSLTVDNITIDSAVISSDTGAISFSDENLTTTGSVTANSFTDGTASLSSGSLTDVKLGSLTSNGFVKTSDSNGTLSVDTSTYLTAEADTLDTVADRGTTTDQTLTVGGISTTGTVVGSNIPAPTVDDQVLISTASGVASWSTAGNNQVLTSDGTGEVAWTDKNFADGIPANSAQYEVYVGTGVGTADWTTDLVLTSLTVDNITINGAVISSDTGAISFSNENLTTTGTVVATNLPSPTVTDKVLTSTGSGTATWQDPTGGVTDHGALTGLEDNDHTQYVTYSGASGTVNLGAETLTTTGTVVGSNIPAPTVTAKVLTSTGSGTATWQDSTGGVTDHGALTGLEDNDHTQYVTYSGASGTVNLDAETLTTTGTVVGSNIPAPTVDDQVLIATASGVAAWSTAGNNQYLASDGSGNVAWVDKSFGNGIPANSAQYEIYVGTGAGTADWTTDLVGLTSLTVDNITINGAVISSDMGAISFSDENLTTTGTITGDLEASAAVSYLNGVNGSFSYTGVLTHVGASSETGTCVIDLPTVFINRMQALRILGYNYSSNTGGAWSVIVGGYNYATTDDKWLNHHASIQGIPPFTGIRLGWNGNTNKACIMLGTTSSSWSYPIVFIESMIHRGGWDYHTGWAVNFYTDESNFTGQSGYFDPVDVEVYRDFISPTDSDKVLVSTGVGTADWSTDLTLTGTVTGTNIPSPTGDDQALSSSAAGVASWNETCLANVLAETVPSFSGAERKFVLTADSAGKFEIESAPWTLTVFQNETVYVRTTGDDVLNDGSSDSPFLTLERTIEYLGQLYIGDYTIIIDIGEGIFPETGTLSFQHPFGSQVTWQGVSEQITSQDTASIGSSETALGFSSLISYEVTFVLPVGKSVSVGDYIAVRTVSGGTLPDALLGCHYVSEWVGGSRTATVQIVYRNGANKASGTVTCTVELIKTVIAFNNKNGLKINGTYTAGIWRGLVLEGNYDTSNTDAKYGIWLLNGASINFGGSDADGDAVAIVGFQTDAYSQNNAMLFADYSFMSLCGIRCANAQNGGILSLRYAHLSGAGNQAIFCFNGSTCSAQYVTVAGCGNSPIYSYQGSFIDVRNCIIFENGLGAAFLADRWSGMDVNSATYTGTYSPTTPGNNDGSYVITT